MKERLTTEENVRPLLPGDDLLLSFEFEHEMNVDEVRVVLVHAENPRDRVVLVDDEPSQVDERHTISGKILKRSEVYFRETITGSWNAGDYKLEAVEFLTSGGRLVTLPDEINPLASLAYVIGREPESMPMITRLLPIE